MTSGSGYRATGTGTGTSVPASALSTRYSRLMSCAVGSTWPSGGRRSTSGAAPSPGSSRYVRLDRPPAISRTRGGVSVAVMPLSLQPPAEPRDIVDPGDVVIRHNSHSCRALVPWAARRTRNCALD